SAERALRVAQRLWEQGHWAPAIRPPTVPRGSARLRLSVTAAHSEEQVEKLAEVLRDALKA
ncbi:MAG: 8-amino-7-oxononanoate synthase, partial [Candidatus Omnitrophica bacterium CG11_big_fil_rev_8_21_14_0_20_63_9]